MPANFQYMMWEFEKLQEAAKKFVSSEKNPVTGGIKILWTGSQAEYDAIAVKDDSTLYVIV